MTKNSQKYEIDLTSILNTYKDEVVQAVKKAQKETATETVQELKSTSPKRSGKYARGWTQSQEGRATVIHNKVYQITHLLEDGHANRDGGRTRAYPHIAQANEKAAESFRDKIEKGL